MTQDPASMTQDPASMTQAPASITQAPASVAEDPAAMDSSDEDYLNWPVYDANLSDPDAGYPSDDDSNNDGNLHSQLLQHSSALRQLIQLPSRSGSPSPTSILSLKLETQDFTKTNGSTRTVGEAHYYPAPIPEKIILPPRLTSLRRRNNQPRVTKTPLRGGFGNDYLAQVILMGLNSEPEIILSEDQLFKKGSLIYESWERQHLQSKPINMSAVLDQQSGPMRERKNLLQICNLPDPALESEPELALSIRSYGTGSGRRSHSRSSPSYTSSGSQSLLANCKAGFAQPPIQEDCTYVPQIYQRLGVKAIR